MNKTDKKKNPTSFSEKHVWKLLEAYFKDNSVANMQINSYNNFVQFGMQEIVDQDSTITVNISPSETYIVKFGQISLAPPQVIEEDRVMHSIYPADARLRDLNYDSAIHCDITEEFIKDGEKSGTKFHPRQVIGRMPVMLGSDICNLSKLSKEKRIQVGECPNDPGGYFIIRGNERVIVSSLRANYNQIFVLKKKDGGYTAEVRSMSNETGHSVLVMANISEDGRPIEISLPYIEKTIPVGVVFKALGYTTAEEMRQLIGIDHSGVEQLLSYIERDSTFCKTSEDAQKYIGQFAMHTIDEEKEQNYAKQVVETELFPHLGITGTNKEQALFVANILNKLLSTYLGIREVDDRDHYMNKRVEVAGMLIAEIFRNLFKLCVKFIRTQLEKRRQLPDITTVISRIKSITKGMNHCMSTGSWSVQKNPKYARMGVSQILDRMTYLSSISHLRRILMHVSKDGKIVAIRQVHPSQYGMVCPSECFDPNTQILMWDGTIKYAKDIVVGDYMISETGEKTRVKSTCKGFKKMYKICHKKRTFSDYVVTDNHILTLKSVLHKQVSYVKKLDYYQVIILDKKNIKYKYHSFSTKDSAIRFVNKIETDNIVDITIENYLNLSKYIQSTFKMFKCDGVKWPERQVDIDPYILGMWLGDGISSGYGFASKDKILISAWNDWSKQHNTSVKHDSRYKYNVLTCEGTFAGKGNSNNPLRSKLLKYNLINNKHVPTDYMINSRENRLKLLAGIIDTDGNVRANGHEIRISQCTKNKAIIDAVIFISRSLGFSTHYSTCKNSWNHNGTKKSDIYHEVTITGKNIYEIPTKLPRKKLNPSNDDLHSRRSDSNIQSDFTLVEHDVSPFCGWQLENNGRFLLHDFTVTHNTPEGAKVGTVLNFAITATVSKYIPTTDVRRVLDQCKEIIGVEQIELCDIPGKTRVLLNNVIIGYTDDYDSAITEIKKLRSSRIIPNEVSITYDIVDNDIKIYCDEGRFIRPLLAMKDNKLLITGQKSYSWKNLVDNGIIQYIDSAETENSVIAMSPKYFDKQYSDFCEIHPICMLGIVAMCTPFSDHSQSPRNCYQASMGKQAIGMPTLAYNQRTHTILHVLHYPQKPLVSTKTAELVGINDMPSGINAIVAIMPFYGYNQEDSVMLNKGAVDRGMFHLTFYRTLSECERKCDTYSYEKICVPPYNSDGIKEGQPGYFKRRNVNYSLLDKNGIVRTHNDSGGSVYVKKDDVIIGKVIVNSNKAGEETCTDISRIIQAGEEGIIDRVETCITPNGYKLVKVVIRKVRIPTLGDKLASREAQKGTIGMIYSPEDMPFTVKDGIVPDIIINPLCLSGDSYVSLSDRSVETIDNIVNDETKYNVQTVCSNTLEESKTGIHSSFSIKPDNHRMVRITTWSGRQITCTDDHPFLVGHEWIEAKNLRPNIDKLSIVHSVKPLSGNGKLPQIDLTHSVYDMSDFTIDEKKLRVLARLLGSVETDGHLCIRNRETMTFRLKFYLGEQVDVDDMCEDITKLGFSKPTFRKVTTKMFGKDYQTTYDVNAPPKLGFVLYKLGAHTGRKSTVQKQFPMWIWESSDEVKRQFLSGIQGGDGSYISTNEKTVQQQVRIKPTKMTSRKDVITYHKEYMNEICKLFNYFDINCTVGEHSTKSENSKEIVLNISVKNDNLERYADIVEYAYCNHKRTRSRVNIEYLKLRNRGYKFPYSKMKEFVEQDIVQVFVNKVEYVENTPLVYDFATVSENHSFIANSIVVHNCMPSRMTINQLIECALGKMCTITGETGDATPFTSRSHNVANGIVDKMKKNITQYGFVAEGTERMINGMTGEMIEASIYIGPTYYQRLKHMVDDKMHARARGHVTMLTRQPLEGSRQPIKSKDNKIKLIFIILIIVK